MDTLNCGHKPTAQPEDSLGTGMAQDANGYTMCYECATQAIKIEAESSGTIMAYVSMDGKSIVTWNGDVLGKVRSRTVSGHKAWYRTYMFDGKLWYGQGPSESGTYVSLRRYKNQAVQ